MKKLMFAMAVMAAGAAAAGVSFSYQGALKTADGGSIPVSESNKTIEFRLYESPTDSSALWGLKTIVHLDENGLFNVELSDTVGTPLAGVMTNNLDWVLASYLGNGKTLYIGLYVLGSTGEIRPRQQLLNVPAAAFAADVAEAKNDFTVQGLATFNGMVNVASQLTAEGDLKVKGGLTAEGDLEVNGNLTASGGYIVPKGGIIMWSGSEKDIPTGWALCDGKGGTPDLRGRFIVGASAAAGDLGEGVDISYLSGDTGGKNAVKLTVAEMPSHTHLISLKYYWTYDNVGNMKPYGKTGTDPTAESLESTSAGGNKAHENRPPYYALCFIMKL